MTEPATIRYVTLTGRWVRIDGVPASGSVTVASLRTAISGAADTVLSIQPITLRLDEQGRMSVQVPVSVQSSLPDTVYVELHVMLTDARPESLVLRIPGDAEVVDIADAERVPSASDAPTPGVTIASLDDLTDVDTTGATQGQVLSQGTDGIWRPVAPEAAAQRGDAVWFRAGPPPGTSGHVATDVWIDLADEFRVYQMEET